MTPANLFKIAEFIFNRPNRLSTVINPGVARQALGEAYSDAFLGHYFLLDEDHNVQITRNAGKIEELRKMYEDDSDLDVGDTVEVVDQGRTYDAAVKEKDPNGQTKLSFGPNGSPLNSDRAFNRNEIKLKSKAAPTPGVTTQQPPRGASAPGTQSNGAVNNPYRSPGAPGL